MRSALPGVGPIRSGVAWAVRTPPAALLVAALDRLGGSAAGVFAVLTYHRVDDPNSRPWLYPGLISASPHSFERQMEFISKHYQPVSMQAVLAAWKGETRLPRRAIAITFDDAYRDFQEIAWPVLRRMGIPVTLFVPTAYPDDHISQFWWDRLWAALLSADGRADLGEPFGSLPISSPQERARSARWLIDRHQSMDHDEAMASVENICRRLGQVETEPSILNWAELRRLASEGVTLAAHSETHPLLTRVPHEMLHKELKACRETLRRQTANAPGAVAANVVAYPAGAFDERVTQAAAAADYELGFTTQRGVNRRGRTDPLALRRINVGARSDGSLIRAQVVLGTIGSRLGFA